jgi:hypothetical protein
VKIELEALSEAIGVALTAIFDPVEESPENPCHFVIVPTDASIEDLLVSSGEFMADDFPHGASPQPKKPRSEASIAAARVACANYDRVFDRSRCKACLARGALAEKVAAGIGLQKRSALVQR